MRINKYIARAEYCSRRNADNLIKSGLVAVNNKKILEPYFIITPGSNVTINNRTVYHFPTQVYILNKPSGILTTTNDPVGRKTIYQILPKKLKGYVPIGRLDYNTTGLLLLTNNGELANYLMMPKNKIIRKYKVSIFGEGISDKITLLKQGLKIKNIHYRPMGVEILRILGKKATLLLLLKEGKNREIRKCMEFMKLSINKLKRVGYGKFEMPNKLHSGECISAESYIINFYLDKIKDEN